MVAAHLSICMSIPKVITAGSWLWPKLRTEKRSLAELVNEARCELRKAADGAGCATNKSVTCRVGGGVQNDPGHVLGCIDRRRELRLPAGVVLHMLGHRCAD